MKSLFIGCRTCKPVEQRAVYIIYGGECAEWGRDWSWDFGVDSSTSLMFYFPLHISALIWLFYHYDDSIFDPIHPPLVQIKSCHIMAVSILPGIVVDVHRRLTILFSKPHHVQHRHAQTLLLGLVAYQDLNPAIKKVATPLKNKMKKRYTKCINWSCPQKNKE